MSFPYPPAALQERVGGTVEMYDELGAACHRDFVALLPESFAWEGARVLDFGSGAGRTLRHFADEAARTEEFWACDIDEPSIGWMQANLSPPFKVFRNDVIPPLPFPDASLDAIYSMSVFTHLADTWSAWILELHRVLKPGGTLLATTLGPGSEHELRREWQEDRIGMLVLMPARDFVEDHGGPMVFHSEWWIREHWGRAFDVVEYWPCGFPNGGPTQSRTGQGCAVLRKRDVVLTTDDLERPSQDPREWAGLAENLDMLHEREAAWRERAWALEADLDSVLASHSWRYTRGLRALGGLARRSRPPSSR